MIEEEGATRPLTLATGKMGIVQMPALTPDAHS